MGMAVLAAAGWWDTTIDRAVYSVWFSYPLAVMARIYFLTLLELEHGHRHVCFVRCLWKQCV